MTWSPDPRKNRAFQNGESAKVAWELVPYTRGVGLDLGCGPWKAFPHFIGIDGQAYPGSKGGPSLVMDCARLGVFSDGAFDFVFSSHLLEHIEDTRAVLREWWRVIRPGGHLLLYLPHKAHYPNIGEPGANEDHKHDFEPQDIVDAMQAVAPDWDLVESQERAGGDEYSFLQVYRKLPAGGGQLASAMAPRPEKRAAILRPGAYGDVIWTSSITWHLKREGFHVTVYTGDKGEEVLRHDPNVDRIIALGDEQIPKGFLANYFIAEAKKYDVAINLVESIERNAIAWPSDVRFYWPANVRRDVFGGNYLELLHDLAGVPHEFHQRFYPTEAELAKAKAWQRDRCGAEPMVVLAPAGSTPPKFWPHTPQLVHALADQGLHVVVLGDTRGMKIEPGPRVHPIGLEWPIREACALALVADAVIGQETALLNAVALEPMRKVVLLSHSTPENLTKHWTNTVALHGAVPCYPCHQIHQSFGTCTRNPANGTAACQSAITPEAVLAALAQPRPDEAPRSVAQRVLDAMKGVRRSGLPVVLH
jgi:ADP-heptose:LPS heptosyltransferase/predicted SAM-dependent methyltransferase